jgi:subtilisin family serine protease
MAAKKKAYVSLLPHTMDKQATAVLPEGGYDKGQILMGLPVLHKQGLDGRGVVVGVIDTGIAPHPFLPKPAVARDYVQDGKPPEEWHPHGTHVAGTIAAARRSTDGEAQAQLRFGMAPGVTLHDYRVLDAQGHGEDADVTMALRHAVADGCHIVNLSLGTTEYSEDMHKAVREAVAAGVLVVVAVGNDGLGAKSYPGYFAEVVGVGAAMFMAEAGVPWRAWFSSANDEVDLCAPGVNVLSTVPGGGWLYMSGTSMATPHVAGFAALLRQKGTTRLGGAPTEGALYGTLKAFHTVDVGPLGIDAGTGAGFVTAYPALPSIRSVEMTLGQAGVKVDGLGLRGAEADLTAYLQWGKSYVPVRAWNDHLGVRTDFDPATNTVKGSRIILPGSEL